MVWEDGIDVGTGQVPVRSRSESEVDTVGGPEKDELPLQFTFRF